MDDEHEETLISLQLGAEEVTQTLQEARTAVEDQNWEQAADRLTAARGHLEAYTYGYPNPQGVLDNIVKAQEAVQQQDEGHAIRYINAALAAIRTVGGVEKSQQATQPQSTTRVNLAGTIEPATDDSFLVTIIDAGKGNGFTWPPEALQAGASIFNGVTAFTNHERRDVYAARPGGRIVDDICGVYYDSHWDPDTQAIRARLHPTPPRGEWVAHMINAIIRDREAGQPVPNVGVSADVSFTHSNSTVTRLVQAHSADIVFNPARGPHAGQAFARIANQVQEELNTMSQSAQPTPDPHPDPGLVQQFIDAQRETLLDTRLANSRLPQAMQDAVRNQLLSNTWTPAQLEAAITAQRNTWAALREDDVVKNLRPAITQMTTGLDHIEEALLALIEGRRPRDGIRPLSGIREAYTLLSGDFELTGLFQPDRINLANVNSTTMAGLVANAMNKIVVNQFQSYPRFWEPIVTVEDFTTLQTVRWMTLGGIGELPTVAEGAAYSEMTWDDQTETATWAKKGGYLGLTLEAIDKDDTRRLQQAPKALAQSAWLTLGKAFANIFTQNSGTGPTMSDSVALFHASHSNLGSTALSVAAWGATKTAMRKQTEVHSGERLGGLVVPRYLLVPPDLEDIAVQVLASANEAGTADNDINPYAEGETREERLRNARRRVIVIDLWTDTNNWAAAADPRLYPSIGLGFRFGRTPEIFSIADKNSGLMFTNDVMPIKVRFFFAIGPTDWRSLYKHNVA